MWRVPAERLATPGLLALGVFLNLAVDVFFLVRAIRAGVSLSPVYALGLIVVLALYLLTHFEGGDWAAGLAAIGAVGLARELLQLPAPVEPLVLVQSLPLALIAGAHYLERDGFYRPRLLSHIQAALSPDPDLLVLPLGTSLQELEEMPGLLEESPTATSWIPGERHTLRARGQEVVVWLRDEVVVGVTYDIERNVGDATEAATVRAVNYYLRHHGFSGGILSGINNGFAFLYGQQKGVFATFSFAGVLSVRRDDVTPVAFASPNETTDEET